MFLNVFKFLINLYVPKIRRKSDVYPNMHFSCRSCYLPEGWGEGRRNRIFSTRETLNGRTIDDVGTNVETRDFRTCSQACLCDSRNPAPPALELSLLPVKRRAELKSAFRNCAPSRKHPQGKEMQTRLCWVREPIKEEGRQQKCGGRGWERLTYHHSQDRGLRI